jgi:Undecaprenyl-phosphate galactose phosphotransferase WbaP
MIDNLKLKKIVRIALIGSDLIAIVVPAGLIYTFGEKINNVQHYRTTTLLGISLFAFSILFCAQTIFEQYTIRRSLYDEFTELLQLYLFNALAFLSSIFIFELSDERKKHIFFLAAVFILIPLLRHIMRYILNFFSLWKMDCLVFSPQSEFDYAKTAIEAQFNLGMTVRRSSYENRLLLKFINEIERVNNTDYGYVKKQIIEYYESIGCPQIIIFSHRKNLNFVPKIVELLMLCGLPYSIIPDVGGVSLLGARVSHFFRWEVLLITPRNNIERASYQLFKRLFDLCLATIFIILLFFPMLIIYFYIRNDGGSAIFMHERVGKGGRKFTCYKFRSMKIDSEKILHNYLNNNPELRKEWSENHKIRNDPRITPLGYYLRSLSLDELPQLYNVLIGDMSLVGPRPIIKDELFKYGKNIELYYKVRPGITGLWQISGRSNTTYSYRVALDIWYIKNWSLWYDLAILAKTIIVVLQKTGAR